MHKKMLTRTDGSSMAGIHDWLLLWDDVQGMYFGYEVCALGVEGKGHKPSGVIES